MVVYYIPKMDILSGFAQRFIFNALLNQMGMFWGSLVGKQGFKLSKEISIEKFNNHSELILSHSL